MIKRTSFEMAYLEESRVQKYRFSLCRTLTTIPWPYTREAKALTCHTVENKSW